jgi:hypothetical protein
LTSSSESGIKVIFQNTLPNQGIITDKKSVILVGFFILRRVSVNRVRILYGARPLFSNQLDILDS